MSTQSQQLRSQRLLEAHANGWHEGINILDSAKGGAR